MVTRYVYLLEYPDGKKYVGRYTYHQAKHDRDFNKNYWGSDKEAKLRNPRKTGVYPTRTILQWCNDQIELVDAEHLWIWSYVQDFHHAVLNLQSKIVK